MAEVHGRNPSVNDIFVETGYEDEPEVLEPEVDICTSTQIEKRLELIKAGGEEAGQVLTTRCNCVWKKTEWQSDWKKTQCMSRFTRKET